MIRRYTSFLIAAGLIVLASAAPLRAADAPDSRQQLLDHLARTRQLFLDSISGLSEAQWAWKPAPEKWSIAECAEHITRSESFIRDAVRGSMATPTAPELLAKSHGKTETVLKFIVDRSGKFQAPEPLNPMKQGSARSHAAVVADFNFERGRTTEMAASVPDLTAYALMHPGFQELDLVGWLNFLSGHTERHTLQIAEVKSMPGYPKQ
jgi:hypothetical protein